MYTFFQVQLSYFIFEEKLIKSLPLEGKVSTRGSEASDAVDG